MFLGTLGSIIRNYYGDIAQTLPFGNPQPLSGRSFRGDLLEKSELPPTVATIQHPLPSKRKSDRKRAVRATATPPVTKAA